MNGFRSVRRRSKCNAVRTEITLPDGSTRTFDSKKEARVYAGLAEKEAAGEITNLRMQVPFELIPNQRLSNGKCERACKYYADFVYEENGATVVLDAKGFHTDVYKIKKKLMKYIHGIEIVEV